MTGLPAPAAADVLGTDLRRALLVTAALVAGLQLSVTDDYVGLAEEGAVPSPLLVAGTLSLTFRRLFPHAVLAVNVGASLVHQGLGLPLPPLPLGVLVAVFTVAVTSRPLVCAAAAAGALLSFAVGGLSEAQSLSDDQFYTYLVSLVAAVTVGYGVQLERARLALVEQRADQLAQQQAASTRVAVVEEQRRIAREMHDLVAHDVSVIVAQAAAARRVGGQQPGAAREALVSIEAVGRDALDGLRRLVGLLRTDADADRSPQPCLGQLPLLLAQLRSAGLPVELEVHGRVRPLPAGVELNAFRIVQEALTNTLKHAGPTSATVSLGYEERVLDVEVRDHGAGDHGGDDHGADDHETDDHGGGGYGLLGMQQRAALLGGQLTVQPVTGVGFRVAVRLPVPEGPS